MGVAVEGECNISIPISQSKSLQHLKSQSGGIMHVTSCDGVLCIQMRVMSSLPATCNV